MKVPTGRKATAVAAVGSLVLTGCLSSGEEGGSSDDTVTIGVSLPLTGDYSEPGKGVRRGYEAWADYVNENGGLLGQQVELNILDDQSNADRVASDYEKLINQDQVDLVFGPFSTRLVIPAAQVAQDYGMLFVEPAGAAPEVFEQGFDNLFYAAPAVADDHYDNLADKIESLPPGQRPKTAAYAAMDDPFAQGTAYGLKSRLEEIAEPVVGHDRRDQRRRVGGCDDVEHAGRQAGVGEHVGEQEARQRGQLGGLEHHGAAGRDGGPDLAGGHGQREVPRCDQQARSDPVAGG